MYCPEDSVFSLTNSKNNGGCHFTKKVQKSPLYLSYILIQERLGILAARCALYITYSIRFEKNDILRQYNDKFIYTPSRSAQNHHPPDNVRRAEGYIRISHNLPSPSPKTIEFMPSGAKTQKKEIIPYPRCGFGACLRCR